MKESVKNHLGFGSRFESVGEPLMYQEDGLVVTVGIPNRSLSSDPERSSWCVLLKRIREESNPRSCPV